MVLQCLRTGEHSCPVHSLYLTWIFLNLCGKLGGVVCLGCSQKSDQFLSFLKSFPRAFWVHGENYKQLLVYLCHRYHTAIQLYCFQDCLSLMLSFVPRSVSASRNYIIQFSEVKYSRSVVQWCLPNLNEHPICSGL